MMKWIAAVGLGLLGTGCGPGVDSAEWGRTQAGLGAEAFKAEVFMVSTNTTAEDELLDAIIDQQTRTLYVAGYENGTRGQSSVEPSGNARGIVRSYSLDSLGSSPGQRNIDTQGTDVIQALALHPTTRELYFAGRTTGQSASIPIKCGPALDTTSVRNCGQYDILAGWWDVTATGATGLLNAFQFGTERPQNPQRLAVDATGNMFISGHDDIYVPSNYVEAWENPFTLKLRQPIPDAPLAADWYKPLSTSHTDLLPGQGFNAQSGALYVSGANLAGTSRGMFVEKRSAATGNLEAGWPVMLSRISADMAAATHVLPTGQVAVAGSTYAQLGNAYFGEQDVFVRILRPDGTTALTHQYGTEGSEWVTDMTVDVYGNIYVVGETTSAFGNYPFPVDGENDIFVLKFESGQPAPKVFQIGSWGDDHPAAITVDDAGNIYVVGYTTGQLGTQAPKGRRDSFILKLSPSTGGVGI
jgi:hypothetical protein